MLRCGVAVLLLSLGQFALAEVVQVKYHGVVSLESFACTDVRESSDVSRICYDPLSGTWSFG